jgi:aspartate/methionine/tyrosine aminotransferase
MVVNISFVKSDGINCTNWGFLPTIPTGVNIGEAGVRAIVVGFTKCTANEGILELREAVAEKLRADIGLEYEAGLSFPKVPNSILCATP